MGDNIELVIKVPKKLVCDGFERPFTEEEKSILIKAIGNGKTLREWIPMVMFPDAKIERGLSRKWRNKNE